MIEAITDFKISGLILKYSTGTGQYFKSLKRKVWVLDDNLQDLGCLIFIFGLVGLLKTVEITRHKRRSPGSNTIILR